MPAGVRIEGLSQTVRNLERLGVEVTDLKEVFGKVSEKAANDIKNLTPLGETGAARNSVRAGRSKNKALVRAGTRKTIYPRFLNNGYRGRSGLYFMEEGARDNRDYAARQIEAGLADLFHRHQ